jgi:uncharacterized membrane protein
VRDSTSNERSEDRDSEAYILQTAIIAEEGPDSRLGAAVGRDLKDTVSPLLYLAAIPLAFVSPWIALAVYVLVALMWLVPDRRIESAVRE